MGDLLIGNFGVDESSPKYIVGNKESGKYRVSGVSCENAGISVICDNGMFSVVSEGNQVERADIAEIMWMIAYFIDSEQVFCPENLIGLDYDQC